MELVSGVLFIGTVIVAVTEFLRLTFAQVSGGVTILVAGLVGLLVSIFDVQLGVESLTAAQGIMTGLSAAGVVAVAKRVGHE